MGAPFWIDNPDAWDRPVFGEGRQALTMPGISRVKGKGVAKLDRKSAPGSSGATVTYLGADPIEVEITTIIWEKSHLQELERVLALLAPRPAKGVPAPVRVSHPKLQMFGVSKLFVSEIGLLEESSSVRGAQEITIRFVQFLPPLGGQTRTNGKQPKVDLESLDPTAANFNTADGREVVRPPPSKTNSGPK